MPYSRAVANPRRLSNREYEVWERLGWGATNREIAAALVVSVKTVETHIANIREKFGVETPREVLVLAVEDRVLRQYGLVPEREGRR